MNSLILLPNECSSDNTASIIGARAKYVLSNHKLDHKQPISVSVWGKGSGIGQITNLDSNHVQVKFKLTNEPLARQSISLIVALPRPQTVKKVIHAATCAGVKDLIFIRSSGVVKSYLQSSILNPDAIKLEIIKALEQSKDSIAPQVKIFPRFKPFIEDTLPQLRREHKEPALIAAHTDVGLTDLSEIKLKKKTQHIYLAIGPESGWSDYEIQVLEHAGFKLINLGPRVMRVEFAVNSLLAKTELLRSFF